MDKNGRMDIQKRMRRNSLRLSPHRARSRAISAFSLVEVIAVLSIISILAAVTVPSMIRQIDRDVRKQEAKSLDGLSDGLKAYARNVREIPSTADWHEKLALEANLAPEQITVNRRDNTRRYLIHPDFEDDLSNLQSPSGLPAAPDSPKIIILASVHEPLPTDPIVEDASHFDDLWATGSDSVPDRLRSMGWTGQAEDLLMEKINLSDLFHQVRLTNLDENTTPEYYIDDPANSGTVSGSIRGYFLDGTLLGLKKASGNLMAEEIVRSGEGLFYKHDTWYSTFPGTYYPTNDVDPWVAQKMEELKDWIMNHEEAAPGDMKFQMYSHGNTPMFKLMAPGN